MSSRDNLEPALPPGSIYTAIYYYLLKQINILINLVQIKLGQINKIIIPYRQEESSHRVDPIHCNGNSSIHLSVLQEHNNPSHLTRRPKT